MATLRTILYGYTVEKGKVIIQQEEAITVRDIFSQYISGATLQAIAEKLTERQIAYSQEKSTWNKNAVSRIIENSKYIGAEGYPAIITEETFQVANERKNQSGRKTIEISSTIAYLKSICFCNQCGGRFKRINIWGTREKWMCANGCKCLLYIDDKRIGDSVLNAWNTAVREPDKLRVETHSVYAMTIEETKRENELFRLLDQPRVDFKTTAESILRSAEQGFRNAEYDRGEATEALQQILAESGEKKALTVELLNKYIRKVKIHSDGRIAAVFCNNAEVAG